MGILDSGVMQDFRVLVAVGWHAGAQKAERGFGGRLDLVRLPGSDANDITGHDGKLVVTERHQARTIQHVVDLFGDRMAMQKGRLAGNEWAVGDAATFDGVVGRMHQFGDDRAVTGHERVDRSTMIEIMASVRAEPARAFALGHVIEPILNVLNG